PPVSDAAAPLWYRAKALEMAATLLFHPSEDGLFCERQKQLNRERVEKVAAILRAEMAEPPSLEEMGRRVGCSHFHLTRIFTREMGKTISCYLRDECLVGRAGSWLLQFQPCQRRLSRDVWLLSGTLSSSRQQRLRRSEHSLGFAESLHGSVVVLPVRKKSSARAFPKNTGNHRGCLTSIFIAVCSSGR